MPWDSEQKVEDLLNCSLSISLSYVFLLSFLIFGMYLHGDHGHFFLRALFPSRERPGFLKFLSAVSNSTRYSTLLYLVCPVLPSAWTLDSKTLTSSSSSCDWLLTLCTRFSSLWNISVIILHYLNRVDGKLWRMRESCFISHTAIIALSFWVLLKSPQRFS